MGDMEAAMQDFDDAYTVSKTLVNVNTIMIVSLILRLRVLYRN
jgi:hypothetical protein